MLFVLLVFLLSDTIRLNRRCLFKITGYIHSIYRVGWDTILARWSLDIDSIYSRFTLVLPSLLPRCSLGLSLTLASHWLWLSVHRRLTVGITPLCSWSYTYTKKRTDWYAMSGSICHRFFTLSVPAVRVLRPERGTVIIRAERPLRSRFCW